METVELVLQVILNRRMCGNKRVAMESAEVGQMAVLNLVRVNRWGDLV